MQIFPTKSTFFRKKFGGTRHPYGKNEPTLDHSGGGGGCTVRPAGLLPNRPDSGIIYDIMKKCRSLYHYMLRSLMKQQDDKIRVAISNETLHSSKDTYIVPKKKISSTLHLLLRVISNRYRL